MLLLTAAWAILPVQRPAPPPPDLLPPESIHASSPGSGRSWDAAAFDVRLWHEDEPQSGASQLAEKPPPPPPAPDVQLIAIITEPDGAGGSHHRAALYLPGADQLATPLAGETVEPGLTIRRIWRDGVELDARGRSIELLLDPEGASRRGGRS